jgi:hypothetical protein
MAHAPTRKLERRNVILALVAIALGAVLVLRPAPTRGVSMEELPALLPGLDTSAVREIEIVREDPAGPDQGERLRIVRKDVTSWTLPDRFDHPALPNTAERLLDALAGARDRGTVTTRADTFDRYRPTTGWKIVRVKDAAGKVLADLALGRSERADLLVRVGQGDGARIARVARLRPSVAPVTTSSWIETQLWPGNLRSASMVRLDLDRRAQEGGTLVGLVKRGASGDGLGLVAPAIDADAPDRVWWMYQPEPGADADTLEVEDRGRSFTGLVAEDVVASTAAADADAGMGFAKPELVATFYAQEGSQVRAHQLTVGGRHPDRDAWYVKVEGRPFIYLVGAGHALTSLRAEPGDFALDGAPAPDDDVPPR